MKKALCLGLILFLFLLCNPLGFAGEQPIETQESKMNTANKEMLEFYRTQSIWTDPGGHEEMFKDISDDIEGIVAAVQGVFMHGGLVWLYKLNPSEEQGGGFQIRRVDELLSRVSDLDNSPLGVTRPHEKRLLVNCRQFAVLTCAIFRYKGIPARVRAGYALYTWGRGKYENHWVCEYWNQDEERWIMVDTQIDEAQRKLMRIDFNTLDMPEGKFIVAGKGWQLYREGKAPAENFGLGGKDGWNPIGWDMVLQNVTCDAMAVNKTELLPWDFNPYWNQKKEEISTADMNLIERAAALTAELDNGWRELRELYEQHKELQMPEGFDD